MFHITTVKIQTKGNSIKDLRNKESKLKAQEVQTANSNHHLGSTKASEKSHKKKTKKFLKEKRDKRKDLESILVTRVNTTKLNPIGEYRRKITSQVVCYNCSKKDH